MEVGEEGEYIPIATLSPPLGMTCIKMGSDESHFSHVRGHRGRYWVLWKGIKSSFVK